MDRTFGSASRTRRCAPSEALEVPGERAVVARTPARGVVELKRVHEMFLRWNRMDKVFIAAINGPSTAEERAGLACDLRYMAKEAR